MRRQPFQSAELGIVAAFHQSWTSFIYRFLRGHTQRASVHAAFIYNIKLILSSTPTNHLVREELQFVMRGRHIHASQCSLLYQMGFFDVLARWLE